VCWPGAQSAWDNHARHLWRHIVVCKLKNIITDKVNVGMFTCDVVFSIVKYVPPDGFFGIQTLPNSITAGGAYDTLSPFPTPLNAFGVS